MRTKKIRLKKSFAMAFVAFVLVDAFNSSTLEAEPNGSVSSTLAWPIELVSGQPGLHKETLSQSHLFNICPNIPASVCLFKGIRRPLCLDYCGQGWELYKMKLESLAENGYCQVCYTFCNLQFLLMAMRGDRVCSRGWGFKWLDFHFERIMGQKWENENLTRLPVRCWALGHGKCLGWHARVCFR